MIYVDADACPVKPEIIKVAERNGLPVTFVANTGLRPSRDPMIINVIVSGAFDAADDWIAERAGAGDIVVTADVPLAERCVLAGAQVTGPTGRVIRRPAISAWPAPCAILASICARPARARATTLPFPRVTARPSCRRWNSFAGAHAHENARPTCPQAQAWPRLRWQRLRL